MLQRVFRSVVIMMSLVCALVTTTYAQDDNGNAGKVALLVFQAENSYDQGRYEDAINLLDQAANLMDSTTADIQYMLAKSNYALNRKKQTHKDVYKYLEISIDTLTDRYAEMVMLKDTLDAELGTYEVERDVTGLVGGGFSEQETWDFAQSTKSLQAYRNYVKYFPEGIYVAQAKYFIKQEETRREAPSKFLVDAVKRGDMKEVRKLIESGTVDVNYVVTYKQTFEKSKGNAYDLYFETPLYMALYKFDYSMAKYLLENGADPNRFTTRKLYDYKEGGRSRSIVESMIIATSKNGIHKDRDEELIDFLDLMMDHGLDINFYQGSPLATAVYYHDRKEYRRTMLIRFLLRKGANPRLPGWADGKMSAIDIAKARGDKKTLSVLKDKRYKKKRKEIAKKKAEKYKKLLQKEKEAKKKAKEEQKKQEQKEKEAAQKEKELQKQAESTEQ